MCCIGLWRLGGKSVIQGMIAKSATDKHNRVLFLVHRKELCEQIRNTFTLCGVDFNYCDITMVQTTTRRITKIPKPNLIITDEFHHGLANSYKKIYDYFDDVISLGFSATPYRNVEKGLSEICDCLVIGVSTKWLIDNHYLAPYKYYGVTLADTSKLHTKNGDFDKTEVEALMNQSYIFGSAIDNWLKYAKGKRTIIYCSSIATSKAVEESFSARGISCMHLDGATPQKERERVVKAFRDGEITCLTNVDLFGEGFDVPDCECVVLLRPTKSLSLHIQQSMRSMRYKPGKVGIILDHVGNYARHGLPDDDREWTLDGKEKRAKTVVMVKECPECFAVNPANATVCYDCGAELKTKQLTDKEKKIIEEVILEEIKQKPYGAFMECKTFEELVQFQKAKKFAFGWVIHKAILLHIKIPTKYAYMMKQMGMNYREVMEFIE